MASEARLQVAKENVLKAGKDAQKAKEDAKTAFKNDEFKSDDQSLSQWVVQNYPPLPAIHSAYQSAAGAYMAALVQVDQSAAKERQDAANAAMTKFSIEKNDFERIYYIDLPKE